METPAADVNQVTQPTQDALAPATSIHEVIARQEAQPPADDGEEQNTPEPPASETDTVEATPAEPESGSEAEGGDGGQPETSEHTQSDGEGGPSGEEEGEIITSFAQLIEHQEWDPEWADNLTVTQVVNGETRERTIGELKAIDQTMEAAEQRLNDAKAKSQEWHQEATKQREGMAVEVAGAASLVTLAENLLQQDEARLAELKDTDREAYLILKDEIAEQKQAVAQVRGVAANAMRELLQQITAPEQLSEEERTELAREEHTKLIEAIPEWQGEKNQERAQKESADLVNHAIKTYGFSDEEISQVMDHRIFRMARDAMLYRRQEGAAEAARDKVLRIPRVMNGGSADQSAKTSDEPKTRSQILYPSK